MSFKNNCSKAYRAKVKVEDGPDGIRRFDLRHIKCLSDLALKDGPVTLRNDQGRELIILAPLKNENGLKLKVPAFSFANFMACPEAVALACGEHPLIIIKNSSNHRPECCAYLPPPPAPARNANVGARRSNGTGLEF